MKVTVKTSSSVSGDAQGGRGRTSRSEKVETDSEPTLVDDSEEVRSILQVDTTIFSSVRELAAGDGTYKFSLSLTKRLHSPNARMVDNPAKLSEK